MANKMGEWLVVRSTIDTLQLGLMALIAALIHVFFHGVTYQTEKPCSNLLRKGMP